MIARQVHRQDRHADKHREAHNEPLRQVGIHNCIESMHQKLSVCGFDACASSRTLRHHDTPRSEPVLREGQYSKFPLTAQARRKIQGRWSRQYEIPEARYAGQW